MNHLLTTEDMTLCEIEHILRNADDLAKEGKQSSAGQQRLGSVANLFFEPSTRTKFSFEMAEEHLGLHVLNVDEQTSSIQKGETLYDTVRLLEEIGVQAVVIRHAQQRYFDNLAPYVQMPVINAGDGCGYHPTQSLLDVLTIKQEFGSVNGLRIAIAGDISHSRVARSNAELLHRMGADLMFTGPDKWLSEVELPGVCLSVDEAVEQADVFMLLRIQHERHGASMAMSRDDYHDLYGLTMEREQRMPEHSIIMHPAPVNRGVEIDSRLVECQRSRIFKQMANGVAVRMAILEDILAPSTKKNNESLATACATMSL